MSKLNDWKQSPRRKPLILNGARQVGKTWLLNEFGATRFENVAYVNFDGNPAMASVFEAGYDIPRLLTNIQAGTGTRIVEGETLVILDEVQECPKALTSLKYFCEDAPGLHVSAAGSLLGLAVHQGTGFPVGKVNTLDLHPLTFREFMDAMGNGMLRELVDEGDPISVNSFASRLVPLLRQYCFVGGMPEAVSAFVESGVPSRRTWGPTGDTPQLSPRCLKAPLCARN
ncbi:MAG: AAA family ATPase [Atopobiaceae bacterium]|nr:AAA family ATPase [Atopobiaceae bacterium]